jgi:membrane protein YdbS with pleckstrin-like domain
MSEEVTPSKHALEAASDASEVPDKNKKKRIYLVSYPKIIFLYPTLICSVIAGIVATFAEQGNPTSQGIALVFLMVTGVNLVVIAFDFPRTTSLTLFFFFAALGMGLTMVFRFYPDLLPSVTTILESLKPYANAEFYFLNAGILSLIFVGVFISVQFDYWEVRPNELLHHHGILSDLERFSAPNLRIDKEINDVFEYMLLKAGRLILQPSNERKAVVLDNIFFINKKEAQITRMLGAVQVQLRSD